MIKKVFIDEMNAPFVAGIFLCGVLAAIMSTADSQLLVSASSMSKDLYKGIFRKDADEKTVMVAIDQLLLAQKMRKRNEPSPQTA